MGFGFWVLGLEFRVQNKGSDFRVRSFRLRVNGVGVRFHALGFGVRG